MAVSLFRLRMVSSRQRDQRNSVPNTMQNANQQISSHGCLAQILPVQPPRARDIYPIKQTNAETRKPSPPKQDESPQPPLVIHRSVPLSHHPQLLLDPPPPLGPTDRLLLRPLLPDRPAGPLLLLLLLHPLPTSLPPPLPRRHHHHLLRHRRPHLHHRPALSVAVVVVVDDDDGPVCELRRVLLEAVR